MPRTRSHSQPAVSRITRWRHAPPLAESDPLMSRWLYLAALGVVLLVALALRVWNLSGTDLWSDEVHTLRRIRMPFSDALDSILYAGNQTPFYYLLLRLLPGDSIQTVRATSIAFGLLNIALLSAIVTRFYRSRVLGLALAALLAVNPMHVVLSRTARFYTLLLALSMVVMVCFPLLLSGRRGRGLWAVFGVSSMALYLLHYTGLALPATQFVFLLANHRRYRDVLRVWIPLQLMAVLPLLAWYGVLALYWFTPYLNGPSSFSYDYLGQSVQLKDGAISVLYLLTGFDGRWDWLLLPGIVVTAAGVIAGLRDAVQAWRTDDRPRSTWALAAVATFAALFGMALLVGAQYRDRYYAVVLAAMYIVFGLGVRRWAQPVALAALVIAVLTGAYSTLNLFRDHEYERSDWSALVAAIDAQFAPGDALLVDRALLKDTFEEHYHGDTALLEAVVMLEGKVGSGTHAAMMRVEPDVDRIWVIYRWRHEEFHRQMWEYREPLTPRLSPTSDWLLAREARIMDVQQFRGLTLYLVRGQAAR